MAAKFSKGDRSSCAYSEPPTYSTKLPSSSLKAVRTSSSSSTESARKARQFMIGLGPAVMGAYRQEMV